jgi:hypothetical protein
MFVKIKNRLKSVREKDRYVSNKSETWYKYREFLELVKF